MVPTIGRIVWYYPDEDAGVVPAPEADCVGAMVQGVRHDNVMLSGIDADANYFSTDWIPLFNPGEVPEEFHAVGGYATWMPYQVAQAAKESGK